MSKKVFKKAIASLVAMSMIVGMTTVSESADAKAKKIKLNKKKVTIKVGKKVTLKLKNAKKKKVKWKSKNKKIATVTKKGVVKGKKKGKTTIIATYKGKKYKCKVTVKKKTKSTTTASPSTSTAPQTSQTPAASATASAVVTASPALESASPVVSESTTPVESLEPVESTEPTVSEEPTVSDEPTVSEEPTASDEPSESPAASKEPVSEDIKNGIIKLASGMEVTADDTEGKFTVSTNKKGVLKLEILQPGEYTLSSDEEIDARVNNEFTKPGAITLILNGVTIRTSGVDPDKGVINFDSDVTETNIIVKKDTVNTIINEGATGTDESETETYDDGTIGPAITYPIGIQARNTLNITGEDYIDSVLNIISPNGDGIKVKSDNGTLNIKSLGLNIAGANDFSEDEDTYATPASHNGISAKEKITIDDAMLEISAANAGIKTTLDVDDYPGDEEKGNLSIAINDSDISINSLKNGISCSYEEDVEETNVASGEAVKVNTLKYGNISIDGESSIFVNLTSESASKAISAGYDIEVIGESMIEIRSDAKGIDCSSELTVDDSEIYIVSVKNAMEAGEVNISGELSEVTLEVSSKNGISASDGITITDATVDVQAQSLAFKTDSNEITVTGDTADVIGISGPDALGKKVTEVTTKLSEESDVPYATGSFDVNEPAAAGEGILLYGYTEADGYEEIATFDNTFDAIHVIYVNSNLDNYDSTRIEKTELIPS